MSRVVLSRCFYLVGFGRYGEGIGENVNKQLRENLNEELAGVPMCPELVCDLMNIEAIKQFEGSFEKWV